MNAQQSKSSKEDESSEDDEFEEVVDAYNMLLEGEKDLSD